MVRRFYTLFDVFDILLQSGVLTWASVARCTVFRSVLATSAGIGVVAPENGVTLVRRPIVALLQAESCDSRPV